jgi:hypothetical protein
MPIRAINKTDSCRKRTVEGDLELTNLQDISARALTKLSDTDLLQQAEVVEVGDEDPTSAHGTDGVRAAGADLRKAQLAVPGETTQRTPMLKRSKEDMTACSGATAESASRRTNTAGARARGRARVTGRRARAAMRVLANMVVGDQRAFRWRLPRSSWEAVRESGDVGHCNGRTRARRSRAGIPGVVACKAWPGRPSQNRRGRGAHPSPVHSPTPASTTARRPSADDVDGPHRSLFVLQSSPRGSGGQDSAPHDRHSRLETAALIVHRARPTLSRPARAPVRRRPHPPTTKAPR